MTVIIKEGVIKENSAERSQELQKMAAEKFPSKVETNFLKFYISPKFCVDDIIAYILERAIFICKDCLERVHYIFYQILSGKTEEYCVLGSNISEEEVTYYSSKNAEEFFAEKEYNVLGVTQAEKDAVYKITAAMLRVTSNKIIKPLLHDDAEEQIFDALGLTQMEKESVYKTTADLLFLPGNNQICLL